MKRLKRLEMMDGINLHALNQPVSEAGSLGNNNMRSAGSVRPLRAINTFEY